MKCLNKPAVVEEVVVVAVVDTGDYHAEVVVDTGHYRVEAVVAAKREERKIM